MSLKNEILEAWSKRNRMRSDAENMKQIADSFSVSIIYVKEVVSTK